MFQAGEFHVNPSLGRAPTFSHLLSMTRIRLLHPKGMPLLQLHTWIVVRLVECNISHYLFLMWNWFLTSADNRVLWSSWSCGENRFSGPLIYSCIQKCKQQPRVGLSAASQWSNLCKLSQSISALMWWLVYLQGRIDLSLTAL